MVWDGTHYRPFTYRKARKSLKTGHFPGRDLHGGARSS
jgi:hypothetical protein